jgi:hypothetical protein
MKFEGTRTATHSTAPTWARDVIRSRACEVAVAWGGTDDTRDWRIADRELRGNARDRSGLDAHEMSWLRVAEKLQIWKPLGMVSMIDYMERVLGYKPRTGQERLRVARALADLPQISEALAKHDLKFSPARELCRVATPQTEAAWLERAAGKNTREIEEMVAGRQPGDLPDDPPDPDLEMHMLQVEVSGATYALYRQTRLAANDENGTNLAEDTFVARLCTVFLEAVASDARAIQAQDSGLDGAEATTDGFVAGGVFMGRAKYQIATIICERCDQGWQEGRAHGSQSMRRPWNARGATLSTSVRSRVMRRSARTRTFRPRRSVSCGGATAAGVRHRAVVRHAASRSITSFRARRAARMIRAT